MEQFKAMELKQDKPSRKRREAKCLQGNVTTSQQVTPVVKAPTYVAVPIFYPLAKAPGVLLGAPVCATQNVQKVKEEVGDRHSSLPRNR